MKRTMKFQEFILMTSAMICYGLVMHRPNICSSYSLPINTVGIMHWQNASKLLGFVNAKRNDSAK